MKNKLISTGLVTIALLASSNVFAAQKGETYAGVQLAFIDATFKDPDGNEDASPMGLVGRFGSYMDENISIEARLGFGIADDEVDTGVTVELDSLIGVYGVGHKKLNPTTSVYGMVGFTKIEASAYWYIPFFGSGSETADESGLSFGFGANMDMGNQMAFNIEYMMYLSESEVDVNAA